MRKLVLALFGALVGLGAVAAAPAPAEAQGITVRIGGPGYYQRPVYYHRPYYRRTYYRPAYVRPVYYAPRCTVRVNRYWSGYGWVRERRRVCW
jgi:hypothetical protein